MSTEERDLETTEVSEEVSEIAEETAVSEADAAEEASAPEEAAAPPQEEAAPETASEPEDAAQPQKQARRSRRQVDPAVWEGLKTALEDGEILSVKISDAVKAGVITFVNGVRGFIPASLLSIGYVENLEEWIGKTIDAKVITVEPEERRLVLSGKAVEQERAAADAASKLENLTIGDIYDGVVERLAPFGVFVKFAETLSGLVHISQMANKRIETPEEVCKVGDEVKIKVIGKDDGKIRLSMKQASEDSDDYAPASGRSYRAKDPDFAYKEEGKATTGLADLLKDIKLD